MINCKSRRRLETLFLRCKEFPLGPTSLKRRVIVILNPARFAAGKTSALTVWVTLAGELEPVQTTGGWLVAPDKT
jgi:hypothetical protein